MPIWSAALAVIFLCERMNGRKWLAVLLGLVGVAVIVRPSAGDVDAGQLIALASAVGFAISVVLVKSLTRTDAAVAISFWMLVVQSAIGLVPALMVWQWPSAQVWGWVVVVAFCGTYSHYCFARAMQHADATVVVPKDFLRVPLTALVGWLAYSEGVDLFTALGVGLILAGNVLNLVRLPIGDAGFSAGFEWIYTTICTIPIAAWASGSGQITINEGCSDQVFDTQAVLPHGRHDFADCRLSPCHPALMRALSLSGLPAFVLAVITLRKGRPKLAHQLLKTLVSHRHMGRGPILAENLATVCILFGQWHRRGNVGVSNG